MAIRIERNEAGNCINFHGASNPVYFNSCLSAQVDPEFPDTINVINDIKTEVVGDPQYAFFRIPFTEFLKADFGTFTDAQEVADYITTVGNVSGNTDILSGYVGVLDASAGADITTDTSSYVNGAWFYVTTAGDQILADGESAVTLKVDDIIRFAESTDGWHHIPNINASVADIQSSNLTSFDYHIDQSYTGTIRTGSVIYPFTDINSALDIMTAGQSINVKGTYTVTEQILLTKSVTIQGSFNASLEYAFWDPTNGDIIRHSGSTTDKMVFKDVDFVRGRYGIRSDASDVFEIRKCKFINCGWSGQGLSTVYPQGAHPTEPTWLGYNSSQADLQAFWAGNETSNGGATRIEVCRKPLIRESRAEGCLRGFRVQDCGVGGGGFVIENQSIGNIESGIYLAAGSTYGGCQNITVTINYSAYHANNGLLAIGGINNKFSQNEVYSNWNGGAVAWGTSNYTLRDCGLYDNNKSTYNGIGNVGDAKAGIQLNEAYNLLGTSITYNPDFRFIAEILDTQVHYTGTGSNTKKVGILITSGVGNLPYDPKNIIKIDDVGFIDQDVAIDLSEVNTTNLKIMLGDNSFVNIKEQNVKEPLAGNYSELPYSNHVTNVKELDIVVDTLRRFVALHEGVGGKVLNTYDVNGLASVATPRGIDILQAGTKKIQLWDNTLGNVYVNGAVAGSNIQTMNDTVNAAFNMDLVDYKDFIESEVGVEGSEDVATFFYIESPDGVFDYPLFKTADEANAFDLANGGTGTSHTHTYDDDLSGTTWYMPDNLGVMDSASAPVNGVYGTSTNVIWNIQTTDDDSNYAATFNSITYDVQEGSSVNIPYKPAGDTATYNITNVPTGYADDGFNITGTAEDISNGYGQAIQHVINVTKVPSGDFPSAQGTITINVKADLAGNEFTIVDQGGVLKFTQDGGITTLDFNTVTFNAGSTYKFYVDGATMSTNDVFDIVDANGNSVTGNDGLSMTGGSGVGYAGTYFQYVIPSDVEPGKSLKFTDGDTTVVTTVPMTIAGSTYSVDVTGIDLEGPSANQTGSNIADNGGYGWLSIDEPLEVGQRIVMDNAFFTDLFDEMPNAYEVRIGLKGDNWDNGDQSTKTNSAMTGEVFKGDLQLRISGSTQSKTFQLFKPGTSYNTMLVNTPALQDTTCAFIEITSDGNNIRMGFGRNGNIGLSQGDESTVIYSDWNGYKGETGNQGFGITSLDVMFLVTDIFNLDNSDFDGDNVDWTALSEIAIPTAPTANATSWTKAVDFDGSNDYLKQGPTSSFSRIPMMLPIDRQINADTILTEGYTSSNGQARTWASTVTFKWNGGSSDQYIWSMGGSQSQDIHLYVNSGGEIYFAWGASSPKAAEKLIGQISIGEWVSVYVGCAGIRPFPNTDANQVNLNKNFDIRMADANFIANDLDASQLITPPVTWGGTGNPIMYAEIDGSFTVGASHNGNRFNGTIASMVTTTLKVNDQMPQDAEIKMMMLDPMGWLNDYKIGNSYRRPHASTLYNNFQLNDNSAYAGTQVWLMGDGTDDSFSNGIRNQVESTETTYTKLVFNNMQSNDIQNVSISGL